MVNPNDSNLEPDGTPPSDPTPDPSSEDLSSESGPISDELFDSLSELLGDSPSTDEPASLPNLDSLLNQPAEPGLPIEEPLEDPTLIQFTTDDDMGAEPLIPGDSLDTPFVASTPSDQPGNEPSASDEVSIPDPWGVGSTEPLSSEATSPSSPELPSEWSSNIDDQFGSSAETEPTSSPEDQDIIPDPWSVPPPEMASPATPTDDQGEDFTIIQTPSTTDSSPEPIADLSAEESAAGDQLQDLWTNTEATDDSSLASAADGPAEPTLPSPEVSEPNLEIPLAAESVEDTSEFLVSEVDTPAPIEERIDESPSLEVETTADWTTDDDPDSTEILGVDVDNLPAAGINIPIESTASENADVSDAAIPLGSSGDDSPSTPPPADEPILPVSVPSTRESGAGVRSEPVPVAVGSASPSVGSGSRSTTGDLGSLSDKLPLNRQQTVGLLVALSTLGTITYAGVTGNQQNPTAQLIPETSQPSVLPEAGNTNRASGINPSPPVAVAPPQSQGAVQPQPGPPATPTQPPSTGAIGGIGTPQTVPSQLDISDVLPSHWAYPFITKLHAQGVIPDYPDGKFQPDKPVTRAELAAQIQRAFVNEPGQRTLDFSDIPAGYWAAQAIEGAVDKKFMSGYPAADFQADQQRFQPDKRVPRYEVLVALASGLELDPNSPESSLQRFQDQEQLPDWSKGKIAASTLDGMVVNHPNPVLLEPDANATRAEVAVMIHQALVQKGQLEPIESEFVIKPEP